MSFWWCVGLTAAAGAAAVAGGTAAADAPRVVASIKPLHSLVAGVMEGVGTPEVVVRGAGSPHTYALRPSDAQALDEADAVFWIGPDLETFLERPVEALASEAEVVALGETQGLALLPTREGGLWEPHAHHEAAHGHEDEAHEHHEAADGHENEAHAHHDEANRHHDAPDAHRDGGHEHYQEHHAHEHGHFDMHVWLDPHNAQLMVERIAVTLSEVDPANAATYRENAARLQDELAALDGALAQKLAPVRDRPFLVFHDGYHYLEHRYGLASAGSITVDPERRPGARRLREIHDRLDELGVVCVFAEPQFEPALVETVVEGTRARTGVLDYLGADIEAGPSHYFEVLNQLAAALVDCLGEAQSG